MRRSIHVLAAIVILWPCAARAAADKNAKSPVAVPSHPEYNIHKLKFIGGDESAPADFDHSIMFDRAASVPSQQNAASSPPPPSPGLAIGNTGYDYQSNSSPGYQVARLGHANVVHFAWMAYDNLQCDYGCFERYVAYDSYTLSSQTLNQGYGGQFIGLNNLAHAGYTNLAVDDSNHAYVTLHQHEDPAGSFNPWSLYFSIVGNVLHYDTPLHGFEVEGCPEVLWPKIAASRGGSHAVHIVAHSNINTCSTDLLWYWRHNGSAWTGPVILDSTQEIGYALADDPSSDKLAIVVDVENYSSMNGLNNVAYFESTTDGAGWISGSEAIIKHVITNYSDPDGPQAWHHLTTAYDNGGTLHVVWDEQRFANDSGQAAIKHWNSTRQTIRTVALGYWPTPFSCGATNLDLAKITIGIGDGSTSCQGQPNDDFLYVVYTRFAGPTATEQADHSVLGYYNGELYLNVSNNGGLSWSPPRNLTNTKTPNCNPGAADSLTGQSPRPDSVCRSEHWATIGQIVSDIDILYISDKDAGGIPQGEGTWQLNSVMYLRLPGETPNAQYVCPLLGPQYSSSFDIQSGTCGIQVGQGGSVSSTLEITNFGNLALTGQVSVVYTDPPSPSTQWLSVDGQQSDPFSISVGGPDQVESVVMSATGLAHGLYQAELHISHNDSTQGGVQIIPIAFNVSPCACHANPVCDGVINVQDAIAVIARAFRGTSEAVDAGCPDSPPAIDGVTDVDCSGATNVVDVVKMVDVAFRGADPAVTFCSPCSL